MHIKSKVQGANFVAISCDAYAMNNWTREPLLLKIHKVVHGSRANDLVALLIAVFKERGGLTSVDIERRLINFGADGAPVFQGSNIGVGVQLKEKHASFVQTIHCIAHRCNMAFKPLSELKIMESTEKFLAPIYLYFNKSPRRIQELTDLLATMECRELKLLKNVQAMWISLVDSMRRLISQYRPVLAKMNMSKESEAAA